MNDRMTQMEEASSFRLIFETFPVSIVAFSVPFYLGGWVFMTVYDGKFVGYAYVFSLIISTCLSLLRMKRFLWEKGVHIKTGGYNGGIVFYLIFLPVFVFINIMAMIGLETFFYTDRWCISVLLLIVTGLFGGVTAGQILYALTELGFDPKGE